MSWPYVYRSGIKHRRAVPRATANPSERFGTSRVVLEDGTTTKDQIACGAFNGK